MADAEPAHNASSDGVRDLEAAVAVLMMRDWYESIEPSAAPLISVILPTRDRPDFLARALASIGQQSYLNWEAVVVDDSTQPIGRPEAAGDQRIVWLKSEGRGVGAARNLGLEHARGQLITFLDDDNVLGRDWLKAVVIAFEAEPSIQVVIGAQLLLPESRSSDLPRVRYPAFDWEKLTLYNYIDLGMIAHRPMPEHRFDEDLPAFLDWDYVVRITKDNPPLMIPAISGTYLTDAPGRISFAERRDLQKKLRASFRDLSSGRTGTQARESVGVSRDDMRALDTFLQRMRDKSTSKPKVLQIVDSEGAFAAHSGIDFENRHDERGTPFDIILVGEEFDPELVRALNPNGLVVGLRAHQIDYPSHFPLLTHNRRVGDTLWVGSVKPFDAGALFPGSALVKLGYDKLPGD